MERRLGRRNRDLWGYLLFSHGWSWFFWGIVVATGWEAFSYPGVVFLVLGGTGPMLGGIVMSWAVGGRAGLRDLGRRLVDPRLVPARWWAVTVLFVPALTAVAAGLVVGLGLSSQPADLEGARELLASPESLLAFAAFVLVLGPLPEEIGWRGFLLDRCQRRWNATVASLLVGLAWLTWHAPLFAMVGYFAAAGGPPEPVRFAVGIVIASVFYTWIYNNASRSVLAAIVFHFTQNFTGQFFDLAPETRTVQSFLFVVVAVVVVARWGPTHLRRDGTRPEPPY
ncbi:CPBP family intramembrane metalloprotease [Natronococcus pandeyae]|uniref:CPBP family intramembrane metalloprotease n=1 Tax=Natronococcus pandeyae TaxID=2055836 RepID=A0A8J8TSA1_9EURY|nr:type II CAAX endopeptidase family protein [Natronococcus pandeyae]TYL38559.1 CPBP family intramembrane metalloprotease [Natronococcus pandeyae]